MKQLKIEGAGANSPAQIHKLKALITDFGELLASFGIKVKLFSTASLLRLDSLSDHEIADICRNFEGYYDSCVNAARNKIDLKNTKDFLSATLDRLELVAPDEFYSFVGNDDLVEVYDLEHRQIFRNMRFYEVTSYSLADLLTFAWADLYDRSSKVTEAIFKIVDCALSTQTNERQIPMQVPNHILKEAMAAPLQTCSVTFKYMSPIFDHAGNKRGYVCNCIANPLGAEVGQALDFI